MIGEALPGAFDFGGNTGSVLGTEGPAPGTVGFVEGTCPGAGTFGSEVPGGVVDVFGTVPGVVDPGGALEGSFGVDPGVVVSGVVPGVLVLGVVVSGVVSWVSLLSVEDVLPKEESPPMLNGSAIGEAPAS